MTLNVMLSDETEQGDSFPGAAIAQGLVREWSAGGEQLLLYHFFSLY